MDGNPPRPPPHAGQKRKPPSTPHPAPPAKRPRSTPSTQPPRPPPTKRQTLQRDARALATQTTGKAFSAGALDVSRFVKARAFEVAALEDGLRRARRGRAQRAFQGVPREMRRRAGAWEVRRLPRRLRKRAGREVRDDGTATGGARRGKVGRRGRVRGETVKALRALGARRRAKEGEKSGVGAGVEGVGTGEKGVVGTGEKDVVRTRAARFKKNTLRRPPEVKSRFRKRQMEKTWLPTHLYHAKRARMSAPLDPVWRFALPMTPSAKSYRPTHRAASERGAIAWDVSYMATIGLQGAEKSVMGLLRGLGFAFPPSQHDRLWRAGLRTWWSWVHERDLPEKQICPVTVIWMAEDECGSADASGKSKGDRRKIMLRAHPSAFHQLWTEVIRLCSVAKPQVVAEDLRYEIGSIEIHGPAATETLQSALAPADSAEGETDKSAQHWLSLQGVDSPSALPPHALLGFKITDPRLRHPPRPIEQTADEQQLLLNIVDFTNDRAATPHAIFDDKTRRASVAALATQKAINRRKALSAPGAHPAPLPTDPRIPVLVYAQPLSTTAASPSKCTSWTVLLPWRAVAPVWTAIMFHPLSTGGAPRFGGLDQQRQVALENRVPWFPGDHPGTEAGDAWIAREAADRRRRWEARPKGRRVAFDALRLGPGRVGEVGDAFGLEWELVIGPAPRGSEVQAPAADAAAVAAAAESPDQQRNETLAAPTHWLAPSPLAHRLLDPTAPLTANTGPAPQSAVFAARITLLGKGAPLPAARIYRLPASDPAQLKAWLALLPAPYLPPGNARREMARPVVRTATLGAGASSAGLRALARGLILRDGGDGGEEQAHPPCPEVGDLMGYATSGAFNLKQGRGTAMAGLGLVRAREARAWGAKVGGRLGCVCVVRNAGEEVGRVGVWEVV